MSSADEAFPVDDVNAASGRRCCVPTGVVEEWSTVLLLVQVEADSPDRPLERHTVTPASPAPREGEQLTDDRPSGMRV